MFVKASTTSVKAGKVAFAVRNTGQTMHGLASTPAPAKAAGGMLDESRAEPVRLPAAPRRPGHRAPPRLADLARRAPTRIGSAT
jgi:hypothetical protein